MRLRREHEAALTNERETITSLETAITETKAEIEKYKLRQVELEGRTRALTTSLHAKTAQLEKCSAELLTRTGELTNCQQSLE